MQACMPTCKHVGMEVWKVQRGVASSPLPSRYGDFLKRRFEAIPKIAIFFRVNYFFAKKLEKSPAKMSCY